MHRPPQILSHPALCALALKEAPRKYCQYNWNGGKLAKGSNSAIICLFLCLYGQL